MKCPEARQQIFAFLDGESGRHDEQSLYQHLASCSDCSQYLDEARHTNRLLEKSLVHVGPPADLVREVMLRLPDRIEDSEDSPESLSPAESSGEARASRLYKLRFSRVFRNVAVASIAGILLVGGLGLSGNAQEADSFAERVLLVSREGIRRVADVFNIGPGREAPPVKAPGKDITKPPKPEKEIPAVEQEHEEEETPPVVALKEEQGQERRVLPRPKKTKEEARAEVFDTVGDSMPIVAAAVLPVVVNDSIDNARPLWVDDERILYLSENRAPEENTFVIWETDPEGSSRKKVSSSKFSCTLDYGGGFWSPDNNKVAFVTDKNGYWEIETSDLKGRPVKIFGPDASQQGIPPQGALWEYNPIWSSKGEIAFLTSRFGNTDLMAADTEGKQRVLTITPEIEANPTWSPNGEQIAYFRFAITDQGLSDGNVLVGDKDCSDPQPVTPAMSNTGMVPAWSPGGSQLAVNLYSQDEPEKNGIWLVNTDGTDWKRASRIGGGKVIRWSPDGKKIAFTDANGQLLVLELPVKEGGTGRLALVEPTDQNGEVEWVSWSPDSKQLLLEWKGEQNKTLAVWRAELPENTSGDPQ